MKKKISHMFLAIVAMFIVMAFLSVSRTSLVIENYQITVANDALERNNRFTKFATEDYSGMGYESCTDDSDCLSGVQTCKAGVVPNKPEPGYCVVVVKP